MKSKTAAFLVAAAAVAILAACTSTASPTSVATPAPSDAVMQAESTPSSGVQKDGGMMGSGDGMEAEGMAKDDAMTQGDGPMEGDNATMQGDGMQKDGAAMEGDSMAKPSATPAEGMMAPAATPADGMKKDEGMSGAGAMMDSSQRYIAYSPEALAKASENGRAVLFFRADWCPTCRAADADFRANLDAIPSDVTVLSVNYDSESALKRKYAITYQHTFIQVDEFGEQVSRWNGGGLEELLASLK